MGAQGPNMRRLGRYVEGANADNVLERIDEWRTVANEFNTTMGDLNDVAKMFTKAFHDTSLVTETGSHALKGAADDLQKKSKELNDAIDGLTTATARVAKAKQKHADLQATLPPSHGAPPSMSDPAFKTPKGAPPSVVQANKSAFHTKMTNWQSGENAIANAEKQAYDHIVQVDEGNSEAQPPVKKISQDPDKESSNPSGSSMTGGYENSGQPPAYASPGSRSQIAHSKAIIEATNANSQYPDGMGYDIIAQQKDLIAQAHDANLAEWDPSQGMWVNADGSPADSSQYASIEANGELKGVGGGFGMGAVAFGVGGAAVGGGIAMALKARFGTAAAAVNGVKSQTALSNSKLAGAGSRTGATGKAGATSKSTNPNRAGTRGTGAGARGGRKDKKRGKGKGTDYVADYSDDWLDEGDDIYSDENYQRMMDKKRRDEGTGR